LREDEEEEVSSY